MPTGGGEVHLAGATGELNLFLITFLQQMKASLIGVWKSNFHYCWGPSRPPCLPIPQTASCSLV